MSDSKHQLPTEADGVGGGTETDGELTWFKYQNQTEWKMINYKYSFTSFDQQKSIHFGFTEFNEIKI